MMDTLGSLFLWLLVAGFLFCVGKVLWMILVGISQ
jgi:hypothetical protein